MVAAGRAKLTSLELQRYQNPQAGMQLRTTREVLATHEDQLKKKSADLARLTIIAPTEGYVFPPPMRPQRDTGDGRLPQWNGGPFDPENEGALLTASDQFCQIGKSTNYDAVLVIDQTELNLVAGYYDRNKKFPPVTIKLDAYRWTSRDGVIEMLASAPVEATPASLATQGGGRLETKTDRKTGTFRPVSTSYQARVPLSDDDGLLRVGLTGKAKIYTGWQSLFTRLYRYVIRTFHFDW
jgi:putative peptide zinc metalloprotease protein